MVPYVIPGSVVSITLLIAFNKSPIILSGTMWRLKNLAASYEVLKIKKKCCKRIL